MNILLTGFGAFLNNDENPTEEIMKIFPISIYGNKVIKLVLPVDFNNAFDQVKEAIDEFKPEIIINFGLARGRKAITPERVAINVNDSKQSDNVGNAPQDETINPNGLNAYFTKLPLKKIVEKLNQKSIPVSISNTAGTYVCNNIMYRVLEYIDQIDLDAVAGFVHVPLMTEQKHNDDKFTLPLNTILEGVIDIVKCCL
jgi:pyroglutamyl-peptidase